MSASADDGHLPDHPAPRSGRAASPAGYVVAEYADGRVRRHPLTGGRHVVGRSAEAEIFLDDPSVSRRHAELFRGSGGWVIRDLGSRNRTRVNGRDVGNEAVPVHEGDGIEVGAVSLAVSVAGPSAARVPLQGGPATRLFGPADVSPPAVAAAHLTALLDLGQDLLRNPRRDDRLQVLCRHLVGRGFGGRYAAVLRVSTDRGDLAQRLCEAGGVGGGGHPYLSRTVLGAAAARREPVLAGNWADDRGLLNVSLDASIMSVAVVACPLSPAVAAPSAGDAARSGDAADLLYVVLPPEYGTSEWLALAGLAARQHQQAEVAWAARAEGEEHAALRRELERARDIQTRLLPGPAAAAVPGVDVAVGFVPCNEVGGDYVDLIPIGGGRLLLAVADVCGKGLPAALIMAGLHTMVRGVAAAGLGLGALMSALNRHLCQTLPPDSFVTMFAAVLDPATGVLECANAGHPPPFVLPAGEGPARPLDVEPSYPLGLDPDPVACEVRRIDRGDRLVLYTDGLSEMVAGPDGGMLQIAGVGRLLEAAWRPADLSAPAAAEALHRALDGLLGDAPPTDDRTFLLARRL